MNAKICICLLVVASCAVFLQSCASIVSDSKYPVTIQSTPEGANIKITSQHNDNIQAGVTPMTVTLPTKCSQCGFFGGENYTVTFSKEGYSPRTVEIQRNVDGWYVLGNLVFGGLIGWLIVDPATGAMWKLDGTVTGQLDQVSAIGNGSATMSIALLSDIPAAYYPNLVPLGEAPR